jgi:TPR repeat protein
VAETPIKASCCLTRVHPRSWVPICSMGDYRKKVGAGVPIAMRIARAYAAILGVLLCVGSTPVLAGPLEDGQAAYDAGDYETAIRLWRPLAKQGDAMAQHAGLREAREWFRKAADQGSVPAYATLGLSYLLDCPGAPRDLVEAERWIRMAADHGDVAAQRWLVEILPLAKLEPPVCKVF